MRKILTAARVRIIDCPAGKGKGVLAVDAFAAGEVVLEFRGQHLRHRDIVDFTHCLEVRPGEYLGPSGAADDFVNHSCAPNCRVVAEDGAVLLRALRDIAGGEELTFDYSRNLWDDPTAFFCDCGTVACRGEVRGPLPSPSARAGNRRISGGAGGGL